MSNAAALGIDTFAIYEPRLELENKRSFVIVKGGQTVTYYSYPATSASNANFKFIANPPSKTTVLDRVAIIEAPVQITINQDAGDPNTDNILQPGRDAFRSWPIASVTATLNMWINGYQASIESSELIHLLERFHSPMDSKNDWLSILPQMPDNYQDYRDAEGADNNPLADYKEATAQIPRGAYNIEVVSNTPSQAVIKATLREYVVLPPMIWDKHQAGGLTILDTLQFEWILNANLTRIWSHSAASTSTIGSMTVDFIGAGQPNLLLGFITPRLSQLQTMPKSITYPFFQISKFVTQPNTSLAPNASMVKRTNSIVLNSIPRKMYLFARESFTQINANLQNSITSTDTFMRINGISISWDNIEGILSGASPENLYNLSVLNGLNMSWTEWNGLTQRLTATSGDPTKYIGTTGSVICLEFGKDIGLRDDQAEGMVGQYNMQVTFDITNTNQYTTITPDLYIVCVFDGIINISNNSAMPIIGVISRQDVLNAPISNEITYSQTERIYGGGDFFNRFKHVVKKVGRTLAPVHNFVKKNQLISKGLAEVPNPYAQVASQGFRALGYGQGAMSGGCDCEYGQGGVLYGGGSKQKGQNGNRQLRDRF